MTITSPQSLKGGVSVLSYQIQLTGKDFRLNNNKVLNLNRHAITTLFVSPEVR